MPNSSPSIWAAAAALATFAACPSAFGHIVPFYASLDGGEVVGPTGSDATAFAYLGFDHHWYVYDFEMVVEGIFVDDLVPYGPNGTTFSVSMAPIGEEGPVVLDLGLHALTDGTITPTSRGFRVSIFEAEWGGQQGEIEIDPIDLEYALYDYMLYVQIYTKDSPDGEIRGQLTEDIPAPAALAVLAMGLAFRSRRR